MAKRKNEMTGLSIEERLKVAILPEDERPYLIPSNWVWTRVRYVCDFERGITFPSSAKEKEAREGNIACIRTANIQENLEIDDMLYVDTDYMKKNENKFVRVDDILMSSANSRELVGKTSYVYNVPYPMTFGGFVLNIRAKKILSKYLFYFLRFQFLTGKFMGESTQTTNLANINSTVLGNYVFALPPINEQYEIVENIEHLFSKLDEVKEKLDTASNSGAQIDGIKTSILGNALSGKFKRKGKAVDNAEELLKSILEEY